MGIKIIHTTCHTQFGGLEKRIFNEACWMAQKGHEIIIVAPRNTPLHDKSKARGFLTRDAAFKRTSLARDFFSLRALFKKFRPQVLNTHGNEDSKIALSAAIGMGIPLRILSRHISAHVGSSLHNTLLYNRLCDYVFTTADYTTRRLMETLGIPKERIQTLSSGIIPPKFLIEKNQARSNLAGEFGLDPATRFVGFVGRVSRDKGVDLILRAFHRIASQIPHHLAVIGAGTGEYLETLRTLAKDLDIEPKVHFTGFREEVWPYYRALDCKILASRDINGIPFEGIPQSVLEAMYAGCPVIGSMSGGIPDIISHGETGLLFRADDEADLAETILQTVKDETASQSRVEKAFRIVMGRHTIDAMGNKILAVYRDFLADGESAFHTPRK